MKKLLFPLTLLIAILLISSTSDKEKLIDPGNRLVASMKMNDEELILELPEELANYSDIEIPEHYSFYEQFPNEQNSGAEEITDAGATLGRVLFYDRNLSQDRSISCGSCHQQAYGFAEPLSFSTGVDGSQETRNSLAIADIGFSFYPGLYWDERESDLESLVLDHFHHGMGVQAIGDVLERVEESEFYQDLFTAAFGDSNITLDRVANAMSQFISSFKVVNTELDRAIEENDWSDTMMAGREVFIYHCFSCHSTIIPQADAYDLIPSLPFFSSLIGPHNNGLYEDYGDDLGLQGLTGSPSDEGVFKTPTLKNISLTAPYMHDGSIETLEDVIEFYSAEVYPHPVATLNSMPYTSPLDLPHPFIGFDFNDYEKSSLLVFLESLTDQSFIEDTKFSDPFRLVATNIEGESINGLSLFPNPLNSSTTIQMQDASEKIHIVKVMDLSGKLVYEQVVNAPSFKFERGNLSAGIYLMKVWTDEGMTTRKLILQ